MKPTQTYRNVCAIVQPPDPGELNRLLDIVDAVNDGSGALREAVAELLRGAVFNGRSWSPEDVVRFGELTGLMESLGDRLYTTADGQRWLGLNPSRSYELTPPQVEALSRIALFGEALEAMTVLVFARFAYDRGRRAFIGPLSARRGLMEMAWLQFLRTLGIVRLAHGVLEVSPKWAHAASRLMPGRNRGGRAISALELGRILEERRRIGRAAEQWAVGFERMRLRAAGCEKEADAVDLVSEVDVSAGYDIASFDGRNPVLRPDRFIEVKSMHASTEHARFYWSRNEVEAAEEFQDRYWIYLVNHIGSDVPAAGAVPLMIQNPLQECRAGGRIVLTPSEFEARVRLRGHA